MATPKRTETNHEQATISALPTPTQADLHREEVEAHREQYKALEAEWLKLSQSKDALTAQLAAETGRLLEATTAHQRVTNDLATARASIVSLSEIVKDRDSKLEIAEAALEDQRGLIGEAQRQRDEALAQWEEWSKHPFFGAVYQLRRQCGEVAAELAEHVDRVICGVNNSGKAGKVTLVLAIKGSEEHAGALIAAAKVTSTIPKGDPAKAYFFMDNGSPSENDPRQKQLPIKAEGRRPQPTAEDKALEAKLAAAKPVVDAQTIPTVPEYLADDYDAALLVLEQEPNATAATLQRRMKLPYTRAALVFDLLKKRGVAK